MFKLLPHDKRLKIFLQIYYRKRCVDIPIIICSVKLNRHGCQDIHGELFLDVSCSSKYTIILLQGFLRGRLIYFQKYIDCHVKYRHNLRIQF